MSGPRTGSRYLATSATERADGVLVLEDRAPFRFRDRPDNRIHVVVHGDTLFHLAGRYFAPLPRASGYWWVIAEFQPEPIVDPTLEIEVGRELVIPSVRVLTDEILARSA